MNIRLTEKHRDMLEEVKERYKWDNKLEFIVHSTCINLDIEDENLIDDLRELCSEYLLEIGFNEEYSTNAKGNILEELVDKLYIE